MNGVWVAYCLACAAVTVLLLAAALVYKVSERGRERRERRYARRFMQMIAARMLEGESTPMDGFPMCERRGAKAVLARLLSAASASTYADEPAVIRRIVAANGIEGWLLRRVKHSRGYVRARYLAMLSSLPVSRTTAECIRRLTAGDDRRSLFHTMLVTIAADPKSAVGILDKYPWPLTRFEMAELTAMLRRGLLPLAYAPLLESENRNLRMLGLDIIRIFGIAESEHRLLAMIADGGTSDELRDEAVHTLVALHLPVSRHTVAECIRSMPAEKRGELFRRLIREGYSAAALADIADGEELEYVESLAASYKRTLVCQPPM